MTYHDAVPEEESESEEESDEESDWNSDEDHEGYDGAGGFDDSVCPPGNTYIIGILYYSGGKKSLM